MKLGWVPLKGTQGVVKVKLWTGRSQGGIGSSRETQGVVSAAVLRSSVDLCDDLQDDVDRLIPVERDEPLVDAGVLREGHCNLFTAAVVGVIEPLTERLERPLRDDVVDIADG